EQDISEYFWHNGRFPESQEYHDLLANDFRDYRLSINGLVENPVELSLAELRALPHHEQITQPYCIPGWSEIGKCGSVAMSEIVRLVRPSPEANWVAFCSSAEVSDGGIYYDTQPIEQMDSELTMLAYEMNDEPLSYGHAGPVRLRNEHQLGVEHVKGIEGIEVIDHDSGSGSGTGGYDTDQADVGPHH